MSQDVEKAMSDLRSSLSFRNRGGSNRGGSGPTRSQMGGRGGPGSQQEAVRLAQRYHATGSFGSGSGISQTERNVLFGGITLGSAVVSATAPGRVMRAGAAVVGVVSEWAR